MTFTEKYIDRFIYPLDKENPDNFRKGRFFLYSVYIIAFLILATTPTLIATTPGSERNVIYTMNLILLLTLFSFLFIYKKYGKRILLVNILSTSFCLPMIETYHKTGGIYSSDNLNVLVSAAWIFLVADRRSGIAWFLVAFAWWSYLFYAAQTGKHDFPSDFRNMSVGYHYQNFMTAGFFLMVIILFYEQGKQKFLKELIKGKTEIEAQKKELESKNKDITDSINYAKRIQHAVLPNEETINRNIPLSFILFAPRDIVSGDFYWFHEIDKDNYIIVCADCTGHGVPGAMMTVIGSNLLSQIVVDNKITQPSQILLVLDNFINLTLKQQKEHEHFVQDGMDLALLKVDKKNKEFIFSSAKRPAIFIRNKEVREFKGSKHTLGGMITGCKVFSETKMNFREDDIIYFYTDGYTDQFGGPKGKKFSSKQLKEVLLNIHRKKMPEQKETLAATMENWKGSHEQVDDILVMGIKF